MDHTPLRIVQISDTHLMSEKDGALLGVKTDDSFRSVVELLKQDKKKPDLILHSGDIAQDGSEKAYLRLATLLSELNVPIYCVPGNHDNPNIMANVYPQEMVSDNRHIVFKKWHLHARTESPRQQKTCHPYRLSFAVLLLFLSRS